MSFVNIELKARTSRADKIRDILKSLGAEYRGTDSQTDTYFNVPQGRLKLRQGNIENTLIQYERTEVIGPKHSDCRVMSVSSPTELLSILSASLGIKVIVSKKREIYFLDNVKFHIDNLGQLGSFVEIEASDKFQPLSLAELHVQCRHYIDLFEIEEKDMVDRSYSDMLLDYDGLQ